MYAHVNIKAALISEFYIRAQDSVNFFLVALSFKSNFTTYIGASGGNFVCIHYSGRGMKKPRTYF